MTLWRYSDRSNYSNTAQQETAFLASELRIALGMGRRHDNSVAAHFDDNDGRVAVEKLATRDHIDQFVADQCLAGRHKRVAAVPG